MRHDRGMEHPSAALQRGVWDRRASSWEHEGSTGLTEVVDEVLRIAAPPRGAVAVDLGCGTGQLSLPLARAGAKVTAVDVSPEMIKRLRANADREGIDGITGVVASLEEFRLDAGSVDLVVSNYALHHLRDADKRDLVHAVGEWLAPGGMFVLGDMMFGRGLDARDRSIIASKLSVLIRRGPAGWWRVIKNVTRFGLRIRERPLSVERWTQLFEEAGLTGVTVSLVVAEAAVVAGTKPA
jgi:2-polyprenyl-3-methyl-5-hydroxy-6-metoxy-1,4-benzoquinol methylase